MSIIRSAKERAENAARRAALLLEIGKYQIKLNKVISQITRLNAQKNKAQLVVSGWNSRRCTYSSDPAVSDVVIVNVFEGICADDIKGKLSAAISEMDENNKNMGLLIQGITSQISLLEEYKSILSAKIASLQAELVALV